MLQKLLISDIQFFFNGSVKVVTYIVKVKYLALLQLSSHS